MISVLPCTALMEKIPLLSDTAALLVSFTVMVEPTTGSPVGDFTMPLYTCCENAVAVITKNSKVQNAILINPFIFFMYGSFPFFVRIIYSAKSHVRTENDRF